MASILMALFEVRNDVNNIDIQVLQELQLQSIFGAVIRLSQTFQCFRGNGLQCNSEEQMYQTIVRTAMDLVPIHALNVGNWFARI